MVQERNLLSTDVQNDTKFSLDRVTTNLIDTITSSKEEGGNGGYGKSV